MRKLIVSLAIVALLGVVAAQALAATKSVRVGDNFFIARGHPRSITVSRGTVVRWHFTGSNRHDVHATSGPAQFRSSVMRSGTFSKKLTRAGRYVIHCDIHHGMRMTIHVR
jgi:plastocyanin